MRHRKYSTLVDLMYHADMLDYNITVRELRRLLEVGAIPSEKKDGKYKVLTEDFTSWVRLQQELRKLRKDVARNKVKREDKKEVLERIKLLEELVGEYAEIKEPLSPEEASIGLALQDKAVAVEEEEDVEEDE